MRDPSLWFVMYYEELDPNLAFRRAAYTEARCMEQAGNFGPLDFVLVRSFLTERDFVKAWNNILAEARSRRAMVKHGVIMSHAGTSLDEKPGNSELFLPRHGEGRLYMLPAESDVVDLAQLQSRDARTDGTFTAEEIARLPRLPWADNSKLELRGCRTGLGHPSAAQSFRDSQQTAVIGQSGWADFSPSLERWMDIRSTDRDVFLHAFDKGMLTRARNGSFVRLGQELRVFARWLRRKSPHHRGAPECNRRRALGECG